jgi:hypothetical protein
MTFFMSTAFYTNLGTQPNETFDIHLFSQSTYREVQINSDLP